MSTWEVRFSNTRQIPYYFNPTTAQSVWNPPADLSQAQIAALPGAAKYLNPPAQEEQGGKEGQVRASHILCKHAGSRRPSSWKEVSWGVGVGGAVLMGGLVLAPQLAMKLSALTSIGQS